MCNEYKISVTIVTLFLFIDTCNQFYYKSHPIRYTMLNLIVQVIYNIYINLE